MTVAKNRTPFAAVALTVSLTILIVAGILAAALLSTDDAPGPTEITASSSAFGFDPNNLVKRDGEGQGRTSWRSDRETVGAWITLSWPEPRQVRRISLAAETAGSGRATAGYLSFSDGSFQQVELDENSSSLVVDVVPKTIAWLRFTVTAVSLGAEDVGFAKFMVSGLPLSGDVSIGDTSDGNVAAQAEFRQSSDMNGTDPRALQDGGSRNGPGAPGASWTARSAAGQSLTVRWNNPRALAGIQFVGDQRSTSTLARAVVRFGEEAQIPVGGVLSDPSRPTYVAFMPRVTDSLTVTFERIVGPGDLSLSEIRIFEPNATPPRPNSIAADSPESSRPAEASTCASPVTQVPAGLAVSCPTSDSVAGNYPQLRLYAPGFTLVDGTVWPADGSIPLRPVTAYVDRVGQAQLSLDTRDLAPGPYTVSIEAKALKKPSARVLLQLYKPGRQDVPIPSDAPSAGRTLVWSEEFSRGISTSRNGFNADYSSAKPTFDGVGEFGQASFASAGPPNFNLGLFEGMLRIGVEPALPGQPENASQAKPHVGGLLASARPGGSGFSTQYGYFEARMFAPAAPGFWPAFWMLPSDNLVQPTPSVAEIDAVEQYGHDPTSTCQSTHDYSEGRDNSRSQCAQRFPSLREAMTWHTYGVSVEPTQIRFFIDGQQVEILPQVPGGGSPLFFLLDLTLGGGWPINLGAVGDRGALYVDYVRVFV